MSNSLQYSTRLIGESYERFIHSIVEKYNIESIVETGTYDGMGSSQILAKTGLPFDTIECHGMNFIALIGTQYSMKADVYSEYTSINKKTGQKIKDWQYVKTITCLAEQLSATPSRNEYEQYGGGMYKMEETILIKTGEKLSNSMRLANIRLKNEVLWQEDDSNPTVFEIAVQHPMVGPFETITGYQLVCTRSTDQRLYP